MEEPRTKDGAPKAKATRKTPKVKPEVKPAPVQKKFRVKIRRTATLETEVDVKAKDSSDAERMAMERAKEQHFQIREAVIDNEVVSVD